MRSIIYHQYGAPDDVLQLTQAPELPPPRVGEVPLTVDLALREKVLFRGYGMHDVKNL